MKVQFTILILAFLAFSQAFASEAEALAQEVSPMITQTDLYDAVAIEEFERVLASETNTTVAGGIETLDIEQFRAAEEAYFLYVRDDLINERNRIDALFPAGK